MLDRQSTPEVGVEGRPAAAHASFALSPPYATPSEWISAAAAGGDVGYDFVGTDGDWRRHTGRGLHERARRYLGGLARLGPHSGDRVALHLDATDDLIAGVWAALLGGLVAVPIRADRRQRASLPALLDRVAGDGLFVLTSAALRAELGDRWAERSVTVEDIAEAEPADPVDPPHPDRVALVLATAGRNPVVELSGRDIVRRWAMRAAGGSAGGTRAVLDIDGDVETFSPDSMSTVFLTPAAFIRRPQLMLEIVSQKRASEIRMPTFAAALLLEDLVRDPPAKMPDLKSVERILVPIEPAAAAVLPVFARSLVQFGIRPGSVIGEYPLPRIGALTAGEPVAEADTVEPKPRLSVGRPLPGLAIRIGDGKGGARGSEQTGPIEARRPGPGGGGSAGADETWTPTGDTGSLQGGRLTVIGRSKDWLVVNGLRLPCEEIEVVAEALPGIGRAIAVNYGASSMFRAHRRTDAFALIYVAADGSDLDPAKTAMTVRSAIASAFGAGPLLVSSILGARVPRSPVGKVQRNVLAARIKAGTLRDETAVQGERPPKGETTASLQAVLLKILRVACPPHLDVYAAGCDQIDALRLVSEIERTFGISLSESLIAELPLTDLAEWIDRSVAPDSPRGERDVPEGSGEAPLAEGLERKLRQETAFWPGERTTTSGLIFGLNGKGTKPPLFWCLQGARELVRLAQRLGHDQPIYGMRSGLDAVSYSDPNIVLFAAHYTRELIEIDPVGPYWLGGNCQGGLIAAEMSKLLVSSGRVVRRLTLVDTYPLGMLGSPLQGRGQVDMIFGRYSRFNPMQRFRWPDLGWRKYFPAGVRLSYLSCDHAQFFDENIIAQLAELISAPDEAFASLEGSFPAQASPIPDTYWARYGALDPLVARAGAAITLDVTVTNNGPRSWYPSDYSGITFGNHWLAMSGELLVWADGRSKIASVVEPDDSVTIQIEVRAPSTPGDYILEIDMVEEGLFWLKEKGMPTLRAAVRVHAEG